MPCVGLGDCFDCVASLDVLPSASQVSPGCCRCHDAHCAIQLSMQRLGSNVFTFKAVYSLQRQGMAECNLCP